MKQRRWKIWEINGGDDDVDNDADFEPRPTRREALGAVSTLLKYTASMDDNFTRKMEQLLSSFGRQTQLEETNALVTVPITQFFDKAHFSHFLKKKLALPLNPYSLITHSSVPERRGMAYERSPDLTKIVTTDSHMMIHLDLSGLWSGDLERPYTLTMPLQFIVLLQTVLHTSGLLPKNLTSSGLFLILPFTLVLGSSPCLLKTYDPFSPESFPFLPCMIITPSPSALDAPNEYDDPEFNALIANLSLRDVQPPISAGTPPPQTPSPRPPPYSASATAHTFPSIWPRMYTCRPAVYRFVSPSQQGYTSKWSLAGGTTQGVRGGHVHTVGSPRQKPRTKKVVYTTVEAAEAAFAYALARSWTRVSDSSVVTAIPALPQPLPENSGTNPLHGTEALDNRWYNVYRGICPGVYRSHLECQLNTVGVRSALHESVVGRAAAFAKFARARDGGRIKVLAPMYHEDLEMDPFL
ncbi:hypothetical protein B0H13DRAFT_1933427 [Mycena leptocephala]|nr:hypothetical protein B0H13DRAFT_1933427 [Mycena leptocephala]